MDSGFTVFVIVVIFRHRIGMIVGMTCALAMEWIRRRCGNTLCSLKWGRWWRLGVLMISHGRCRSSTVEHGEAGRVRRKLDDKW